MKRVLALLALMCALFVVSACHYDVSLSVEASADLNILHLNTPVHITSTEYYRFHRKSLSKEELAYIFADLLRINHADEDFQTATLYLSIFDEISGKFLRNETYGVVYDSFTRQYAFADLDAEY